MGSLDCVCKISIISLDIKMTMVNNGVTQEVPTVRSQVSADIIAVADSHLLHSMLCYKLFSASPEIFYKS